MSENGETLGTIDAKTFEMADVVYFTVLPSAIGKLTVTCNARALTGVYFEDSPALDEKNDWERSDVRCDPARSQLEEYFARKRTRFDLPIELAGTDFQVKVWNALTKIPFGTTISYGELARRIRKPEAVRAVGAANGKNPCPVIVPCHRVIGADGSLTGFGGGLPRKRTLLDLEGALAKGQASLFS